MVQIVPANVTGMIWLPCGPTLRRSAEYTQAAVGTFRDPASMPRPTPSIIWGWIRTVWALMTVMRRLRCGMVYVNTYFETLTQLPHGGMKQSGKGHENGLERLQEFLETRSAFVKLKTRL